MRFICLILLFIPLFSYSQNVSVESPISKIPPNTEITVLKDIIIERDYSLKVIVDTNLDDNYYEVHIWAKEESEIDRRIKKGTVLVVSSANEVSETNHYGEYIGRATSIYLNHPKLERIKVEHHSNASFSIKEFMEISKGILSISTFQYSFRRLF